MKYLQSLLGTLTNTNTNVHLYLSKIVSFNISNNLNVRTIKIVIKVQ